MNHLRAITWHDMTVSSWRKVLNRFGRVIVDESLKDEETCQPITENDKHINDIIINKPINKPFNGLKKLSKYYCFKSCPSSYRITMSKLTIKGKRTQCYKLIKDDEDNESTVKTSESTEETNDDKTDESTNNENKTSDKINNKPLNQLFRGKRELFRFYNITSCPSNCIIKMKTINKGRKRTRAYCLTMLIAKVSNKSSEPNATC